MKTIKSQHRFSTRYANFSFQGLVGPSHQAKTRELSGPYQSQSELKSQSPGTTGKPLWDVFSRTRPRKLGGILINSVQAPGKRVQPSVFVASTMKKFYMSPSASCEVRMSTETLLIIILVLFLLGGGWGYCRWRG